MSDDEAIVVTTDFFPPMVDDPRDFGRVAAANALSDVWAMGGTPLVCVNIVGFPSKKLPLEVLTEILNGGAEKVKEAGAVLGGGHTVEDQEVKYGLAVTGRVHPDRVWRNGGVREGDVLILTKPVGTGLVNGAAKCNADTGPVVAEAVRWMSTLNGMGIEHVHAADVSAVTDITGFGLVGHGAEMAAGSDCRLMIDAAAVPRLDGIEAYFQDNLKTRSGRETRIHVGETVDTSAVDPWTEELLYDPQTSGGLLMAVREADAETLVSRLRETGLEKCAIVGQAVRADDETLVRARV